MIALAALVAVTLIASVHGHGYLADPPNRSSLWRYGYSTPANYEDNQLFCGGRSVQHDENGGKCGECGDNYALARPRPNENGGTYGLGVIAGTYEKGSIITVTAQITANHYGYFELNLCPLDESSDLETEECFAKYPLALADGSSTKYTLPSAATGQYAVQLQLPAGLTCKQCVLQWTYTCGNSWGVCEDGSGAIGCGAQETFRTCSDITIQ